MGFESSDRMRRNEVRGTAFWCILVGLMVFVLLLAMLPDQPARAEEPEPYTGMDVIFLIDQSGSMGGREFGSDREPNDRQRLRFNGTQFAIAWLGSDRLHYFKDSNVTFRTAVVSFGSVVDVTLPPSTIDPNSREQWDALRASLTNLLAEDNLRQRFVEKFGQANLGNTDFQLAFAEARKLFDQLEQADSTHRLKIIILLTDGEPYVERAPYIPPTPTPTTGEGEQKPTPIPTPAPVFPTDRYMRDTVDDVNDRFPYPEYQIYVVALNDRTKETWSYMRRYWEAITHSRPDDVRAELVENNDTMGASFQRILSKLVQPLDSQKTVKGEEIPITEDRIPVPPYLQEIVVYVHKPSPDRRIRLYLDGGRLLAEGKVDLCGNEDIGACIEGQDEPIETITVYNPYPAVWRLERPVTTTPARAFVVFARFVGPEAKVSPTGMIPQFIPTRLILELGGASGALPAYTEEKYKLLVKARLVSGDEEQWFNLTQRADGKYSAEFLPTRPGTYSIYLEGITQDPDGKELKILGADPTQEASSFTVFPVQIADCTLPGPVTQLIQTRLCIALVSPEGNVVAISSDAPTVPQLTATIEAMEQALQLPLRQEADGTFVADFTPLNSGEHKFQALLTVTDPNTKADSRALEADLGSFEVGPMRFELRQPQGVGTQLVPFSLQMALLNSASDPISIATSQLAPRVEVSITDNESGHTVIPQLQADGTYTAAFTPLNTGLHRFQVVVAVTDPVAQVELRGPETDLGSFEVKPIRYEWQKPSPPLGQFRPMRVAFVLCDQTDRPLANVLDKEYQLVPEAIITAGGQEWKLPLKPGEAGLHTATFKPELNGMHALRLVAKARSTTGQEVLLLDEKVDSFEVVPTSRVSYNMRRPKDGSQEPWRNWWAWWFLERPRPFGIEVRLGDDPAKVLANPQEVPFKLTLSEPGKPVSTSLTLLPTLEPGLYRAETPGYSTKGLYRMRVDTDQSYLKSTAFVWDEETRLASVELVENRWIWIPPTLLALLGAGIIAESARQVGIRIDPARGILRVEGPDGAVPGCNWNLTNRGFNRLTLRTSVCGGTTIRVRHPRGEPGIRVTVRVKGDPVPRYRDLSMPTEMTLPLCEEYSLIYTGIGGYEGGEYPGQQEFTFGS